MSGFFYQNGFSLGRPSAERVGRSKTSVLGVNTITFPGPGFICIAFNGPVNVNVSDVVSYDGYAGRNSVTQQNERWRPHLNTAPPPPSPKPHDIIQEFRSKIKMSLIRILFISNR
ncbi:MAG: hypothetical protein MUF12_09230, partial [Sediminibacterium sp.]|nr:hypothetical protein [Sediminibacterium sp.]